MWIEWDLRMEYKQITFKNISSKYSISEYGDIYSEYHKKILKPKKDKDGYLTIALVTNDGSRRFFRIATLVTIAFIGDYPKDMKDPTVNHIDGNILNNHYTNLEWMERATNSKLRFHSSKGELNGSALLTENCVREICQKLLNTEMTYSEIGDIYNVEKSTISNIKNGKTWKYITEQYPLLKECRIATKDLYSGRIVSVNPLLKN